LATSTKVQICNSALIKLGAETINALSDDNKRARLCNNQYELIRDKLLFSHPWNFAVKRVELGQLASTPEFKFTKEYELPQDVLRVLDTNLLIGEEWAIENGKLLCDSDDCKIRYIAQITDESKFSLGFQEALAWELAEEMAYSITQSSRRVDQIKESKRRWLATSRTYDAQESSFSQVGADDWLVSRA